MIFQGFFVTCKVIAVKMRFCLAANVTEILLDAVEDACQVLEQRFA
ncbi:hypothetical protein GJA_2648 [Janthinobacterium agaricidamnosum NBRC 102515 = DSM 9628]|uniref:Uncharacterized protein n=2 Tax=Janthinobacterium agaricidamnosum TaxID=55508 RepID=W0V368_9BURK|nr:hypothetical protein GJA_2648 [Janthinobacterium agaricidamnosum NBRC 102515 = DSM 9628]